MLTKPNVSFTRRGLCGLLAVAALAVLGAVGLQAVATDSEAGQLLSSELPAGTTLSTASRPQVVAAVRRAIRKSPSAAVNVVRVAIIAKKPRSRPAVAVAPAPGSSTTTTTTSRSRRNRPVEEEEDLCPPCDFVVELTRIAIQENSAEAARLIEEISALCPDCAGALSALGGDGSIGLDGGAFYDPAGPFGFGIGLGPGFPGAPGFGFVGSPPGGVLSLPPTGPATTAVVNL